MKKLFFSAFCPMHIPYEYNTGKQRYRYHSCARNKEKKNELAIVSFQWRFKIVSIAKSLISASKDFPAFLKMWTKLLENANRYFLNISSALYLKIFEHEENTNMYIWVYAKNQLCLDANDAMKIISRMKAQINRSKRM